MQIFDDFLFKISTSAMNVALQLSVQAPYKPRTSARGTRQQLNKFWIFFIFDVFGHSVIEFVKELDEKICPCGHVKSGNRAKMGPKEVGGRA